MKTFKRLFALLLALMMTLTLFACDSKGSGDGDDGAENDGPIVANTPEELIALYYSAVEETDIEKGIAVLNEGVLSYYRKAGKEMENNMKAELTEELAKYEEDYGENIKFEFSVTEQFDMPEEKMADIIEAYTDSYNIDASGIEKGIVVKFDITVKGDRYENDGTGTAYIIKENGQWKIYDLNDSLR